MMKIRIAFAVVGLLIVISNYSAKAATVQETRPAKSFIAGKVAYSITRAQDVPAAPQDETAPTEKSLNDADVKAATDLLVRTARRYGGLKTFAGVIEQDASGGLTAFTEENLFRLQLASNGKFVLGQRDKDGGWNKAIFDGQTVITTGSGIPKRYNRRTPKFSAGAPVSAKLESTLRYEGADGPLVWMLTRSPTLVEALVKPTFLRQFDVTPDGKLQKITIREVIEEPIAQTLNNGKPLEKTLELWIDEKTLTLHKSRQFDSFKGSNTETYTHQRFDPAFSKMLFRAAAPLGYKIIQDN